MGYNGVQVGTVIAFGVTYSLATIFMVARGFQCLTIDRRFDLDLVVLTIAYGLALVYFITLVILMNYGWGEHTADVPLQDLLQFNKHLLPNTLTYLITPAITKLAMLTVLFRINPNKVYRGVVVCLGIAIFAYTLTLTSITGGPCNPIKSGTTKCLENVALSQAILNIASDFAVLATPIPTIRGLMSSTRQKVSVGCIMAIGSGVVVCSIARLPYVIVLENTTDATYTEAILGIWSIVEVNLGIICVCAMRLKTLLKKYLPKLGFFSASRSQAANSNAYATWGKGSRVNNEEHQLYKIQKGNAGVVSQVKTFDHYDCQSVAAEPRGSTERILD